MPVRSVILGIEGGCRGEGCTRHLHGRGRAAQVKGQPQNYIEDVSDLGISPTGSSLKDKALCLSCYSDL